MGNRGGGGRGSAMRGWLKTSFLRKVTESIFGRSPLNTVFLHFQPSNPKVFFRSVPSARIN